VRTLQDEGRVSGTVLGPVGKGCVCGARNRLFSLLRIRFLSACVLLRFADAVTILELFCQVLMVFPTSAVEYAAINPPQREFREVGGSDRRGQLALPQMKLGIATVADLRLRN
jgi:hypothetical protein